MKYLIENTTVVVSKSSARAEHTGSIIRNLVSRWDVERNDDGSIANIIFVSIHAGDTDVTAKFTDGTDSDSDLDVLKQEVTECDSFPQSEYC